MSTNIPHLGILALAGALAAAPVVAVEVTYTPEEQAACEAQGGCGVVSAQWIKERMNEAYQAGKATCKGTV